MAGAPGAWGRRRPSAGSATAGRATLWITWTLLTVLASPPCLRLLEELLSSQVHGTVAATTVSDNVTFSVVSLSDALLAENVGPNCTNLTLSSRAFFSILLPRSKVIGDTFFTLDHSSELTVSVKTVSISEAQYQQFLQDLLPAEDGGGDGLDWCAPPISVGPSGASLEALKRAYLLASQSRLGCQRNGPEVQGALKTDAPLPRALRLPHSIASRANVDVGLTEANTLVLAAYEARLFVKVIDRTVWDSLTTPSFSAGRAPSAAPNGIDITANPTYVCSIPALLTFPVPLSIEKLNAFAVSVEPAVPRFTFTHKWQRTQVVVVAMQCSNIPLTMEVFVELPAGSIGLGTSANRATMVTYFMFLVGYVVLLLFLFVTLLHGCVKAFQEYVRRWRRRRRRRADPTHRAREGAALSGLAPGSDHSTIISSGPPGLKSSLKAQPGLESSGRITAPQTKNARLRSSIRSTEVASVSSLLPPSSSSSSSSSSARGDTDSASRSSSSSSVVSLTAGEPSDARSRRTRRRRNRTARETEVQAPGDMYVTHLLWQRQKRAMTQAAWRWRKIAQWQLYPTLQWFMIAFIILKIISCILYVAFYYYKTVEDQPFTFTDLNATTSMFFILTATAIFVMQVLICLGWGGAKMSLSKWEVAIVSLAGVVGFTLYLLVSTCSGNTALLYSPDESSMPTCSSYRIARITAELLFYMHNTIQLMALAEHLRSFAKESDDPHSTVLFLRYQAMRVPYAMVLVFEFIALAHGVALQDGNSVFIAVLLQEIIPWYFSAFVLLFLRRRPLMM